MKVFPLSSPKERIPGIIFSVIAIVAFGILLYALRGHTTMLIACSLAVLLVSGMLVFYVVSVLKSACVWDPETKQMEVKGIPGYTVDLSKAVLLQTLPRRSGHTVVRSLVFTDAEDNILAAIPTLFSSRQGVMAEPFAMEMAKEMGLPFKANVPEWEYDKEKYAEHQKQVAIQEKEDRIARRKARAEYRVKKRMNRQ